MIHSTIWIETLTCFPSTIIHATKWQYHSLNVLRIPGFQFGHYKPIFNSRKYFWEKPQDASHSGCKWSFFFPDYTSCSFTMKLTQVVFTLIINIVHDHKCALISQISRWTNMTQRRCSWERERCWRSHKPMCATGNGITLGEALALDFFVARYLNNLLDPLLLVLMLISQQF